MGRYNTIAGLLRAAKKAGSTPPAKLKALSQVTQIFVGNLAYTTSERELRSRFEQYGRVSSVRMVQDQQTGNPRGFAFVGMPSWEDADEAIVRLNGLSLAGRNIVVNQAEARTDSKTSPQRKTVNAFLDLL